MTDSTLDSGRLPDQTALLRLFIEHCPAAIAMFDTEMRYLVASRRWIEDLRMTESNPIGRNHYELFPEIPERWKEIHRRCLAGAVEKAKGDAFPRPDGSVDWLDWEIIPWRKADGEIGGIIIFSEAITERKRLETQLQQAQKMETMGRLAAGVAHDFNNTLAVIQAGGDMLLRDPALSESSRKAAERILEAAGTGAQIVRQVMAFARPGVAAAPSLLDLNTVVRETAALLEHVIESNVLVRLRPSENPLPIRAERTQIAQIVLNLSLNARDAMPGGGTIEISAAPATVAAGERGVPADLAPGDYAVLTVRDEGVGMDEATLGKIFDPFFSTKEPGKGTGLGLSIIYRLVREAGGAIAAKSAPGQGSTLRVYWPRLREAVPQQVPSPPKSPARGAGEVILLVEDEESLREITRDAMQANGYRVLDAASGAEALGYCKDSQQPIDLLMTDVVMPYLNGIDLAAQAVRLRPNLKVLLVSGYAETARASNSAPPAGSSFLQKPFSLTALAEKLREILEPAKG